MTKGDIAKDYFHQGMNCSQAVALAFCPEMRLDEELVKRLTIGFGGGMGRMREVCGAVSGMTFVISALYNEDKSSIYKRVQTVSEEFRKRNGDIICRKLLGLNIQGPDSPVAEKRTEGYYKKRPCPQIVKCAADILEEYILAEQLRNNL